jgi:predicted RNA-binding Zn ribbon-like protein
MVTKGRVSAMNTFWQDLVNTDWHDHRGTGQDENRLRKPGWIEHLLTQWDFQGIVIPTEEAIIALQQLRALLQHMIQALLQQQQLPEEDIAALNVYLAHAILQPHLTKEDGCYKIEQVPYERNWSWVLGQIAASFATILADYDVTRIKQCENPHCRWIYYDESNNKTRRWCEESCANIMRVRRFRERHQHE